MDKTLTPIEVLENLKGYQVECLLSKAAVRVMLNSRQSGKTSTLRAIIYKEALENPIDILVLACTHRQVKYNLWKVLVDSSDPIFPPQLIKKINRSDMFIELINGSTIRFSGVENVDAILGATADLVLLDEFQSMPEDVVDKIQPMLSTTNGKMVIAGTVRTRTNQMWKYYLKGQLGHPDYVPGYRSWKVTVHESPTPNSDPDMIRFLKASMSESQFKAEMLCSPDSGIGRIVPDYDIEENRSTLKLNPDKPLLIGIDFNVTPYCAVIHQTHEIIHNDDNGKFHHREEQLHAIEELYIEDTNTQKMAQLIENKYANWRGKIIFYPDASGSARKTSSNTTDHAILRKIGKVVTHKANPLQIDRINSFNALVCAANGHRKYFVNPYNCKHLTESLLGVTFDKKGKIDDKQGLDHMFDATSYCVWQLYPIHTSQAKQQAFFN